MNLKIIPSLILAGLALVFIIQNFSVMNIRFLFWTLSITSSLFNVAYFFLWGSSLGWLLHSYSIHRRIK